MVASEPLTVLLIEDDDALRSAFETALRRNGFTVRSHAAGLLAMTDLTANPSLFQAAVTDVTLPDIAGFELAARIRAVAAGMPVLLMSGAPLEFSFPAHWAFLQKPFGLAKLVESLRALLASGDPAPKCSH